MSNSNCSCKIQLILTEEEFNLIIDGLAEGFAAMKSIGLHDKALKFEEIYEKLKVRN